MAFADIVELGGVAYIEQTRAADAAWGFSHVPKTAGSTLIASLVAHCPPYCNIVVKNYAVNREDFRRQEWESVREFTDSQKAVTPNARCRSFSGHIRKEHVDFIRQNLHGARFFTLLRDPIERIVSNYRYSLTPSHPTHEQFAAEFPTIMDFVRHPRSRNGMVAYLASKDWSSAETVINSVLHGYEFVGIMELYDVSMSMIFRLMGLTHIPTRRVNETISTDRNAIQLSDAEREEILERNALDAALYRAVRAMLEPQCEAWRRHFATLSEPVNAPAG